MFTLRLFLCDGLSYNMMTLHQSIICLSYHVLHERYGLSYLFRKFSRKFAFWRGVHSSIFLCDGLSCRDDASSIHHLSFLLAEIKKAMQFRSFNQWRIYDIIRLCPYTFMRDLFSTSSWLKYSHEIEVYRRDVSIMKC